MHHNAGRKCIRRWGLRIPILLLTLFDQQSQRSYTTVFLELRILCANLRSKSINTHIHPKLPCTFIFVHHSAYRAHSHSTLSPEKPDRRYGLEILRFL